jgi:hypothetical protein
LLVRIQLGSPAISKAWSENQATPSVVWHNWRSYSGKPFGLRCASALFKNILIREFQAMAETEKNPDTVGWVDLELVRILISTLKAVGMIEVGLTTVASQNPPLKAALDEQVFPELRKSTGEMADQLNKLLDDVNRRLTNGR